MPLLSDDVRRFPDPRSALTDPDGLLAMGGDLSPERLINAYCAGIFPWFNDDQPILWWSPSTRALIDLDHLKVSHSMAKLMRQNRLHITVNQHFERVIRCCAAPRNYSQSTWITGPMIDAYITLHDLGFARSIEVWEADELVGGLYGVAIGHCYFGESMFSLRPNASKLAFIHLVRRLASDNFLLIDCQMMTDHLASLGAYPVTRADYLEKLHLALNQGI